MAIVTARILGTPAPGLAVWRSTDDAEVAGDLDGPDAAGLRPGDLLVLEVRRDGFRWLVERVLEHLPTPVDRGVRRSGGGRPRSPHAHPARPPGTVLVAWLPFTREDGDDAPGKHRPCIVVHSADPDTIRARPLFDPASAQARRNGGPRLQAWRAAGLDKPSVVGEVVDIPVARCEQTLGHLSPVDRRQLGIDRRSPRT